MAACVVARNTKHVFKRFSAISSVYSIISRRNITENESNFIQEPIGIDRMIPKTPDEVQKLLEQPIVQPKNPHILHVALLGLTNSGKSTLTNQLMEWRVCPVSVKAHTTRHKCRAIFVEGNKQIVFLDTPGVVSPGEKNKFNLDETMLTDPEKSVEEADLVIALVDAANKWTRVKVDAKILRLLHLQKQKQSILVLNKVDLLKKKQLLLDVVYTLTKGRVGGKPIERKHTQLNVRPQPKTGTRIIRETMRKLKMGTSDTEAEPKEEIEEEITSPGGWPNFDRVFMISAKNNDGINELKDYILKSAKPGPWEHPASLVTDQTPTEIVLMAVKEKLLDHLPRSIPYDVKLDIQMFEVDENGILRIIIVVKCPLEGMMQYVIGGNGCTIAKIAEEAKQELMNTFRCELSLKLLVIHNKKK